MLYYLCAFAGQRAARYWGYLVNGSGASTGSSDLTQSSNSTAWAGGSRSRRRDQPGSVGPWVRVLDRLVLRLHGRYASCTAVYTLVARPLRYHPAVTANDATGTATGVATASVCSVAGPRGPINLAGAVKVLNVLK